MRKLLVSPLIYLTLLFVLLFSATAFSQDNIILLNNNVIQGKVVEVGLNTIQYRRADNPDGPAYDLAKSDIYMIVYANGTSDVINSPTGSNPPTGAANQGDNIPAPDQPITQAPPPMPVYDQPYCPGPGYLWTPGYWAWGYGGYYWVPGVWVMPPHYGLLWTPGYWGFGGGYFGWHEGYWSQNVGYYGGVYYGYGYGGHGYYGGRWQGDQFNYNTSVTRVDVTVVHTTYIDNTVVENNTTVNRSSFNGQGGVQAQPTPEEQKVMAAPHVAPTPVQVAHVQTAQSDKTQYASANGGKPAVIAMNKPGGQAFSPEGKPATLHPNTQPVTRAQPAAQPAKTPAASTPKPAAQPAVETPAKPAQPVQPQPATTAKPAANTAKPKNAKPAKQPKPAPKPVQKVPEPERK